MDMPKRRRWWHRVRFSVRGLLLLVLIIGGLLGSVVRPAQRQREAVARISKSGGWVWYSWHFSGRDFSRTAKPAAPQWLVDLVGVDYFGHVVHVFMGEQATDVELAEVGQLDGLELLNAGPSRISSSGMAHLEGRTRLRGLDLYGTHISGGGLSHLRGMTHLESINLNSSDVRDSDLESLTQLPALKDLSLHRTLIGDTGMGYLKRIKSLQSLQLGRTNITDAGLLELKELPNLTELRYYGETVSSAGLTELQRALPRLKVISEP
jgi:Leucine-rich repeat (LRR) protein